LFFCKTAVRHPAHPWPGRHWPAPGRCAVFETQPVGSQRSRVHLNSHCRLLSAADGDQSHARQLRDDFLRQGRVSARSSTLDSGRVSEVMASVRIGASGRIHLAIDGRIWQIGGEIGSEPALIAACHLLFFDVNILGQGLNCSV